MQYKVDAVLVLGKEKCAEVSLRVIVTVELPLDNVVLVVVGANGEKSVLKHWKGTFISICPAVQGVSKAMSNLQYVPMRFSSYLTVCLVQCHSTKTTTGQIVTTSSPHTASVFIKTNAH